MLLAFPLLAALNGCDRDPSGPDDPLPFVRLLEGQSVQSTLLSRAISYAVLLPQEYETGSDHYPVVYLLHGYGDNEKAWYQGGNIKFYAINMLRKNRSCDLCDARWFQYLLG